MLFRKLFLSFLFWIPSFLCAAPSEHGRPWDDPNYHSSPLGKILFPIAIIVLIIIVICWIFNNKAAVGKLLKNIFYIICGGAFIFGLFILPALDRCSRKNVSASSESVIQAPSNVSSQSTSEPNSNPYPDNSNNVSKHVPKEGDIGYKTKTYRIDVCHTCNGSGKMVIEANWGKSSVNCPTCGGTGKEKIAGNYR